MARHRSFGSQLQFKGQTGRGFFDGGGGLHEVGGVNSLSSDLIRLWIRKYEDGEFNAYSVECKRTIAELEGKAAQLTMKADLLKKGAQLVRQRNARREACGEGLKA